MASIQFYQNGAGGSSGADLATLKPMYASGVIWYVHKSGSNANAGKERSLPLATLAQANTNSAAGDTIVLMSGHTEVISTVVTLANASVKVVSEGNTSGTRAALTGGVGTNPIIKLNAAGILLDNIYFPASTAVVTERVQLASTFGWVKGCVFESGASDTARALSIVTGAGSCLITDTSFTATASGASIGIQVVNAVTGLYMDNVTFDAGSVSWSDFAFKGAAAVTNLHATRMNALNGSHAIIATGSTGNWAVGSTSGDSRVQWTP